MFNLAQLATRAAAKEMAAILSSGPIVVGGGVKPVVIHRQPNVITFGSVGSSASAGGTLSNSVTPEMWDEHISGIYIPLWDNQPWSELPHETVNGELFEWLHFRFNNGAENMNVGLIIDKFKRFPFSPNYVLRQLAEEADRIIHG